MAHVKYLFNIIDLSPKSKWMVDYNKYIEVSVKQQKDEQEESEERDSGSWNVNYGSADPNQPSSSVPCGGCGAHLHCQVYECFLLQKSIINTVPQSKCYFK